MNTLGLAVADEQQPSRDVKNVLFIIADDLRASVLGCYGDPICKTQTLINWLVQGCCLNVPTVRVLRAGLHAVR